MPRVGFRFSVNFDAWFVEELVTAFSGEGLSFLRFDVWSDIFVSVAVVSREGRDFFLGDNGIVSDTVRADSFVIYQVPGASPKSQVERDGIIYNFNSCFFFFFSLSPSF